MRTSLFLALFGLQIATAGFFAWDTVFGVLGLRTEPLDWHVHELIELGAALGLMIGVITGRLVLLYAHQRNQRLAESVRAASSAFADVVEERFRDWSLTPAERDVAWFALKGLVIADIARLRDTSEGTVKAQCNAIYRKAGVSGRAQLLSLFVEELLSTRPVVTAPEKAGRGPQKAA